MAGRPPKPTELKLLDGTFRADRDGDPSTVKAEGVAAPPRGLSRESRAFWNEIVPGLVTAGLAKACDAPQLAAMCQWYARARKWERALDREKPSSKTHSMMVQVAIAWQNFDRVASRFGLTPSDRSKMRIAFKEKPVGKVPKRAR